MHDGGQLRSALCSASLLLPLSRALHGVRGDGGESVQQRLPLQPRAVWQLRCCRMHTSRLSAAVD